MIGTPFHFSLQQEHSLYSKLLINAADRKILYPYLFSNSENIYYNLIRKNYIDNINLLLKNGFDFNIKDNIYYFIYKGQLPIDIAFEQKNEKIIYKLVKKGSFFQENHFTTAIKERYVRVYILMIKNGINIFSENVSSEIDPLIITEKFYFEKCIKFIFNNQIEELKNLLPSMISINNKNQLVIFSKLMVLLSYIMQ